MANDKSMDQFYYDFMEEVSVASDMETSGWTKDDFLTSIMLEYLEAVSYTHLTLPTILRV